MTNAATDSFLDLLSKDKDFMKKHGDWIAQEEKDIEIRYLPTGMISFDALTGGGFPLGSFTELGGDSTWGKTLLALNTAAHTIKHGGGVIYIYLEMGNVDLRWARQLGADMLGDSFRYATPPNGNIAGELIFDLIERSEKLNLRLIVLDSLACMYPAADQIKDMTFNDQMGSRAKLLNMFFRRLGPHMRGYGRNVALVGINQVVEGGVGQSHYYGDKLVTPGGKGKKHQADLQVMMKKPDKINTTKPIKTIGYKYIGTVKKNRTGISIGDFDFDVHFDPEIKHMPYRSLLDCGIDYGVFTNKSGEVYTGKGECNFQGVSLGDAKNRIANAMWQNDALADAIYEAIHAEILTGHKRQKQAVPLEGNDGE